VQSQTGGDLGSVLEGLAGTIRDRRRLRRRVSAITAQGRATAWLLGLLPLAVGLFVLSQADLRAAMLDTVVGRIFLAIALGLDALAVISLGSVVYSVAFNPDSTRLAAGCRDNTVRLFDVASRQQVAELRGHTDYVHAVAWSPDGTRLVSGSGDFTVRVWDALSPADRAKRPDALHPPR